MGQEHCTAAYHHQLALFPHLSSSLIRRKTLIKVSEKDKRENKVTVPHQDVQAGRLQQSDLVSNGEWGEAWQPFSKFHNLDDAFCG